MYRTWTTPKTPLDQQYCDPKYRTPQHKTSLPDKAIRIRVNRAVSVAHRAAKIMISNNRDLEEALAQARREQ